MNNPCRVLIIDDHPLIVDAYKRALMHLALKSDLNEFDVFTADSINSAILKINEAAKQVAFDLVFLDIKLNVFKNDKILNGEELGVLIREKLKGTKIVISTSFNDNYLISCIFKSIKPEAFLLKNDLTHEVLIDAIKAVVLDTSFYSKTIMKIFRKQFVDALAIGNNDRKILYELSNDTKKKAQKLLPLSITASARRRRILKDIFNVERLRIKGFLPLAQEKGLFKM